MQLEESTTDDFYINPRAHFNYYNIMYNDYVTMNAYKEVLDLNESQLKDKIVLEIGSGLGVLSMFAARAGAKKVYSWEPLFISCAQNEIYQNNNYGDVIIPLTGPIESLCIDEKVDIIFTSAFGICAFHKSNIYDFLYARDHFLKQGGILFPSSINFWISSFGPSNFQNIGDFWNDVYGYDFTPIHDDSVKQAYIQSCALSRLRTNLSLFKCIDLYKMAKDDINISSQFDLVSTDNAAIAGLFIWFDLIFQLDDKTIEITNSPEAPLESHWFQLFFPFAEISETQKDDHICGNIEIRPSSDLRTISFCIKSTKGQDSEETRRYIFRK